jgi:NADPH-dependent curcumin reductase CurA
MQGFIVSDFVDQYPRAMKALAEWLAQGQLGHYETIVQRLETFPETFQRLFTGAIDRT